MSSGECPRRFECANYDEKCFLCEDQMRLFKPKSKERPKQSFSRTKKKINPLGKVTTGSTKQGIEFEEKVARRFNQESKKIRNKARPARRVPGSGAIWSMPGDVVTEQDLIECKDRGVITSRGDKQITIKKEWLDKIFFESIGTGKNPMLAFRFGEDDDKIYLVMDIEVMFDILLQISELKARIEELEE